MPTRSIAWPRILAEGVMIVGVLARGVIDRSHAPTGGVGARWTCLLAAFLGSAACSDTLTFEQDRLHVRGEVYRDENGDPIAGARVRACGPSGIFVGWCSVMITTGADGSFELVDQLPVLGDCPLWLEVNAETFVSAELRIACSGGTQEVSVGLVATAQLTVELEGEHIQMTVGHRHWLDETIRTDRGEVVVSPVTWGSTSPSVATVDGTGMVTANTAGVALVVADAGGTPDTVRVTVVEVPSTRTGPTLYTTTEQGVVAVDETSGAVLGDPFDVNAWGLAVTPTGSEVWTASEEVMVIDVATNAVAGPGIPAGAQLRAMAFTPDGERAYATSDQAGTVTVIETSSRTVTHTLGVEGTPFAVAVTPDGDVALVTDLQPSLVRRLDLTADTFFRATVPVPSRPVSLAITPDGARAYVSLQFSAAVAAMDVAGDSLLADPIEVGSIPEDVVVTPDGTLVFVASIEANSVSVIDVATNTVTTTIPVDGSPEGLAVTPDGQTVWVTSANYGTLRRIDVATRTLVGPAIAVGRFAFDVVIAP